MKEGRSPIIPRDTLQALTNVQGSAAAERDGGSGKEDVYLAVDR